MAEVHTVLTIFRFAVFFSLLVRNGKLEFKDWSNVSTVPDKSETSERGGSLCHIHLVIIGINYLQGAIKK